VVLASAFGTAVAMWIAGYVLRFPAVSAPGALVLAVMLGLLVAGGAVVGRFSDGGARRGLVVGLLAGTLNMLVLGSLLSGDHPGSVVPSALLWVPGALVFSALLVGLGGWLGRWRRLALGRPPVSSEAYASMFPLVAAVATLALVAKGGIVTSHEAGLAVPDWPNSYGYNMFLYPLSRMTGGVYYEHAHRLFGALVGLTTVTLGGFVLATDRRASVRVAAVAAVLLVVGQGVLGGLRVTGRFTMSADPAELAPSTVLAVVHGVTGQLFFALLVGIACVRSPRWIRDELPSQHRGAALDGRLSALLVLALVGQLVLGALYRHTGEGLILHLYGAALVTFLALLVGVRVWGLHGYPEEGGDALLGRFGKAVLLLLGLQVCLGFAALVAIVLRPEGAGPGSLELLFATAHQITGALLLASSLSVALWLRRLLASPAALADAEVPAEGRG
jgi:cytochrome c oxidase assembly protein subunit 15